MAGKIYETHNDEFDKTKLEFRVAPVASVDGSTYTLRLLAESEIAEPIMMAIVGFDGQDNARALAVITSKIPEHTAEHWTVTLEEVEAATPNVDDPLGQTNRRATVWGRDGTADQQAGSRCLVIQEWTGSDWNSIFIVPASDHDCDGLQPPLECDEQYFHLNQAIRNCGL